MKSGCPPDVLNARRGSPWLRMAPLIGVDLFQLQEVHVRRRILPSGGGSAGQTLPIVVACSEKSTLLPLRHRRTTHGAPSRVASEPHRGGKGRVKLLRDRRLGAKFRRQFVWKKASLIFTGFDIARH